MHNELRVTFCDLSSELDRNLWLIVHLTEGFEGVDESEVVPELGHILAEYLGRRVVLEHVFLERQLKRHRFDSVRLKAEVWRVQKMKALSRLRLRRTN